MSNTGNTGTGDGTSMAGKAVLVVDDNDLVRSMVVSILEYGGFLVLDVATGRSAIDIVKKKSDEIGCVLLDLSMPHMRGDEVVPELLKIRSDLPVLIYSVDDYTAVAYRLTPLNVAGYIQKPFDPQDLVERIQELMPEQGKSVS